MIVMLRRWKSPAVIFRLGVHSAAGQGDVPSDALCAVPLAFKYKAPLLLPSPGKLPENVFKEIKRLGAEKVVILGGPSAVGGQVEDVLKAAGFTVRRVEGSDRYETAYEIARLLNYREQAAVVGGNTALSFSDALSVSSWAAYHGAPLLYADAADSLPEATAKAAQILSVERAVLVGQERLRRRSPTLGCCCSARRA